MLYKPRVFSLCAQLEISSSKRTILPRAAATFASFMRLLEHYLPSHCDRLNREVAYFHQVRVIAVLNISHAFGVKGMRPLLRANCHENYQRVLHKRARNARRTLLKYC